VIQLHDAPLTGLAAGYFTHTDQHAVMNITLGYTNDKYYSSGYAVWTLSTGIGRPPPEHMSTVLATFLWTAVLTPLVTGGLTAAIGCLLFARKRSRDRAIVVQ
jgi:hypothetical protein